MLNSSFFLKQMGYIELLKYTLMFIDDSAFQVIFPKFITSDLAETIWRLVRVETSNLEKEISQELSRLRRVIEVEVAAKLKEKINVKADPSQKPSEAFSSIRDLINSDQVSEKALIESVQKIGRLIDSQTSMEYGRQAIRHSPSKELSDCLHIAEPKGPGVTESTRGSFE